MSVSQVGGATAGETRCGLRPGRAWLAAWLFGLALAAGPAEALNFVVNSTLDNPDVVLDGVCDSNPGVPVVWTLRAAIQEVNRPANIPPHTITFNLGAGPYSIAVGAAGLPPIAQAVTINGYSQAGSSANSLAVGSNAVLLIELNGAATATGANGLTLNAAGITIRGLVINRFADYGIQVSATGAVIQGNFIGTNAAGTAGLGNNNDSPNGFGGGIGLYVGGATIGGTAPADRNLVSGNSAQCVRGIELYESSNNTIPATASPPPRPCAPTGGSARRSPTPRSSART